MKKQFLAVLSLFASASTLLCCALPTLLVTMGLGAAVAGTISSLPWLTELSRNKEYVFIVAGALLLLNWILINRQNTVIACEVPTSATSFESPCGIGQRFSYIVFWVSAAIYLLGFFVAFLAFPLGKALGWL